MTATFTNPSNGHQETVGNAPIFFALLFGVFYFMVKGLWRHVLIMVGIAALCGLAFGEAGIMFAFATQVIYACLAPSLLRSQYLRNGWVERSPDSYVSGVKPLTERIASQPAADGSLAASPVHYVGRDEKVCPECAETVKAAAKVCRFCRHDFTA